MSTRPGSHIRYVGKAFDFQKRLRQHSLSIRHTTSDWIIGERWAGFDLMGVEIATCGYRQTSDFERYWINRVPSLLNIRMNEGIADYVASDEDRVLIEHIERANRPTFVENFDGWIGVRYYPRSKSWTLKVQALGHRCRWAKGDDGATALGYASYPGPFGRPIYYRDQHFGDLNNAINERDRIRKALKLVQSRWICSGWAEEQLSWPSDRVFERLGWADFAA